MKKINIFNWNEIIVILPSEIQDILKQCEITPQSKRWHPEGENEPIPHNVLIHTKIAPPVGKNKKL